MRRMDYPIAKAKELNIFDKEWFDNPNQNAVYLKKKLPNGIYHLTGYSDIQEDIDVNLYFENNDSIGHKVLFLIPGLNDYETLKNLIANNSFSDGLFNGTPCFSLNPNSPAFASYEIFLIVKDEIVFLTAQSEF